MSDMFPPHRLRTFAFLAILAAGCTEAELPPGDAGQPSQQACAFTEVISPDQFDTTERSGVTTDGRVVFIGTRPAADGSIKSWLAEIVAGPSGGKPFVRDLLAGSLAGTSDGKLEGPASGDSCLFSGMATHGMLVYAACHADDGRASLVQVDLTQKTVRAGDFTTCNKEPSATPCKAIDMYPNGMAVDSHGRIYVSSMLAHLSGEQDAPTLVQIEVAAHPTEAQRLSFRHRGWLTSDIFADGITPNGIQIEGETLYYAAGANLNAVPILADGSAGKMRLHYEGPSLSYIDDFAVREGAFVAARTLPGDLTELAPVTQGTFARELGTCLLPHDATPSSVTRMPSPTPVTSVFAAGTYVVTSYFGGGLYTVSRLH